MKKSKLTSTQQARISKVEHSFSCDQHQQTNAWSDGLNKPPSAHYDEFVLCFPLMHMLIFGMIYNSMIGSIQTE